MILLWLQNWMKVFLTDKLGGSIGDYTHSYLYTMECTYVITSCTLHYYMIMISRKMVKRKSYMSTSVCWYSLL